MSKPFGSLIREAVAQAAYNNVVNNSPTLMPPWGELGSETRETYRLAAVGAVEHVLAHDHLLRAFLSGDEVDAKIRDDGKVAVKVINPDVARVLEIMDMMRATFMRKNADYGKDSDPFANLRMSAQWGVAPWKAAMVRADDKDSRLQNVANGVELKNEGAMDSFIDGATYRIIAAVLWELEQKVKHGAGQ